MFLGQLYYYIAQLDSVEKPLTLERLSEIEIAGIGNIHKEKYSDSDWQQEIKIEFINSFNQLLKDESLDEALFWWKTLTSPIKQESTKGYSFFQSEFTSLLAQWLEQGMPIEKYRELELIGELSTNTTDKILAYGIKLLILLVQTPEDTVFDQKTLSKNVILENQVELNKDYEILVYGSVYLAPLLENINTLFISPNQETMFEHVSKFLTSYPSLTLALIDDEPEAIGLLTKSFPDKLILPFSFDQTSKSFFDQIAKKTLGIRLPS